MDAWITEELRFAPTGLSHGWFISNLEFYDLQDSLSGGTLVAMALSVAVAFSVMLLTTWNIIISLYAILSIAGTIFVTVGSLVLLGWELNVLESVTISVAVGLSVDFAVHYGVAYRLAPEPSREGKVIFSLSRMGSAIAMAALTTFVAGAMMMPSTVLAYTQLGTFMMLIMCISWAFATFFFQCMCHCLGPQGTCGQIPLPEKLQCYTFTETASENSSSSGKGSGQAKYQLDSHGDQVEHYELEPLASSQKTEEQEVCAQLYNGIPHHHGSLYSHIQYRGKNDTARAGMENGFVPRCQHSQNTNCTSGDPLSPQRAQPGTPHPCALPPQESTASPPSPQLCTHSGNTPCKQNPSVLAPSLDPVYTHLECPMHYIHCHPAHFHQCAQGRTTARPGPVHGYHLKRYCVHSGPAREQRSTEPEPACSPEAVEQEGNHPPNIKESSNDSGQSTGNSAPTQHQPRCPSPSLDSSHTTCPERRKPKEPVHCCGDRNVRTTTAGTTMQTDACCKIPGNQEKLKSIPVTREESVGKLTSKAKCNSAAEFNVPKSKTSVPPIAINTNSTETMC